MTTTTVQGEDPLSGDRQPIDMKPSTDHLMQSMAIGYPGPRTKMDGEHDDGDDGDDSRRNSKAGWLLEESAESFVNRNKHVFF